jgi:4-hydroxybenzoate polyprenyltransferase
MYTAGTYVVGYALGMTSWLDFFNPEYIIYLIYFIFPANVFLYGINDYWDLETDKLNPKKEEKEYLIIERDRKNLRLLLGTVIAASIILLIFQKNILERVIFITFLFLSYFYSAKPLRFKAVPFLDFSSNILYIMPGIFAYVQIAGVLPPFLVILAGFLHTSATYIRDASFFSNSRHRA